MNTRKLEESTRPFDSVRWSAIATGAFIALALQAVLLAFGFGVSTSTGDGVPGTGFAIWLVIVDLCSIALGAALAARASHTETRGAGVAAGILTWAVVLVLGGLFLQLGGGLTRLGAWSVFIGDILSLGAAIAGGIFGTQLAGTPVAPPLYEEKVTHVH